MRRFLVCSAICWFSSYFLICLLGKGKILLELMSVFLLCFLLELIVSGLTFICLIHCEFHASKICWRDYPLSIVCSLLLVINCGHTQMGLILGSQFCSFDLWFFFFFLPVPCCFDYYGFALVWNQGVGWLQLCSFFLRLLWLFGVILILCKF